MKHKLFSIAIALALSVSALPTFAQSSRGDTTRSPTDSVTSREDCDQLEGSSRSGCLRELGSPAQGSPFRRLDGGTRFAFPPSTPGSTIPQDLGPQD